MTVVEFLKFKNYKTNTILVFVLFLLACFAGRLSGYFRYTHYRWIFSIGMPVTCLLLLAAFIASFANFVYMLRVISPKDTKKYYCLAVSCIPMLFWVAVIIWISFL